MQNKPKHIFVLCTTFGTICSPNNGKLGSAGVCVCMHIQHSVHQFPQVPQVYRAKLQRSHMTSQRKWEKKKKRTKGNKKKEWKEGQHWCRGVNWRSGKRMLQKWLFSEVRLQRLARVYSYSRGIKMRTDWLTGKSANREKQPDAQIKENYGRGVWANPDNLNDMIYLNVLALVVLKPTLYVLVCHLWDLVKKLQFQGKLFPTNLAEHKMRSEPNVAECGGWKTTHNVWNTTKSQHCGHQCSNPSVDQNGSLRPTGWKSNWFSTD